MSTTVVLLAVAGSFASHASEKKVQQLLIGYIPSINGTPCKISTQCGEIQNTICTATQAGIPYNATGKFNPNDTVCPLVRRARPQ